MQLALKGSVYVTRPALADYIADPAEKSELAGEIFGHVAAGRIKIEINQKYQLRGRRPGAPRPRSAQDDRFVDLCDIEAAMIRFVRVVAAAEVPSDRGRLVFANGRTIAVFKVDGAIHALDDSCPHAGSSLRAAKLEGTFVQCRAHGLRFDVRTGRMRGADGFCAKTYPVQLPSMAKSPSALTAANPLNPVAAMPPHSTLQARGPRARSDLCRDLLHEASTPRTATPTDLLGLPTSTYALLQAAAGRYGDAPALTCIADATTFCDGHTLSFRELLAKVTQAANVFHAARGRRRRRGRLRAAQPAETHFALWGGEAAGIAMAINPALPGEQAADLFRAAGARVLVTMASAGPGDFLASLATHLASCPSLTHVFVVGDDPMAGLPGLTMRKFGAAMDIQRSDALASGRVISPDESSSWFCTGGTTGAPKIARRTHANEVANARWSRSHSRDRRPGPQLLLRAAALPCQRGDVDWAGALARRLARRMWAGEGYRDRGVIANFWALVEAYRINVFSGVPTIYGTLMQQPVDGHDLSRSTSRSAGRRRCRSSCSTASRRRPESASSRATGSPSGIVRQSIHRWPSAASARSAGAAVADHESRDAGRIRGLRARRGVREVGVIAITGPNILRATASTSTKGPGSIP